MKNLFAILFLLPIFLFGQQEIRYVENLGQWNNKVFFKAQIDNGNVYFKKNSIRFNFYDSDDINKNHKNLTPNVSSSINFYSYDINFINSNHDVLITSENRYDEYYNFFLGSTLGSFTLRNDSNGIG